MGESRARIVAVLVTAVVVVAASVGPGASASGADGDAAPTRIWQRPASSDCSPDLSGFRETGGRTLFAASTCDDDAEVFSTDGTSTGTTRTGFVREWAGRGLGRLGDLMITSRYTDVGAEPWVTDGTPEGTRMLRDIQPGRWGSFPANPVVFRGQLYFSATDDEHGPSVWVTDGTPEGTKLAFDPPGTDGNVRPVAAGGRTLYLTLSGEVDGRETVRELWAGDGTSEGTHPVAEIDAGERAYATRTDAIVVDDDGVDRLYTAAEAPDGRAGVWTSDGTAAGTRLLTSNAPAAFSEPDHLYAWRGDVYFIAEDRLRTQDWSLWRTNAQDGVATLLSDLMPQVNGDPPTSFRDYGTGADARLLFSVWSASSVDLWQTDGSAPGTKKVDLPVPSGSQVRVVGAWRSKLVLRIGSEHVGGSPWISDLTAVGTHRLAREPDPRTWKEMMVRGDKVLWIYDDLDAGDQLYSLDLPSATARPARVAATATKASARHGDFSVRVAGPAGTTPTGVVTLRSTRGVLVTVRLVGGVARFRVPSSLRPGTHVLTVTYGGAPGLAASSSTVRVTVPRATARLTLSGSRRVREGRRPRVRLHLRSDAAATAGRWTVTDRGRVVARGTASSTSTTTVRLRRLAPGRHRLVVRWAGSETSTPARAVRTVRVLRG